MIYIACPDLLEKSSGTRVLYRHVQVLVENGFDAAILHNESGFLLPDMPDVPIRYASVPKTISAGDTVVIPEVCPGFAKALEDKPVRRMLIAFSWVYLYHGLIDFEDWCSYGIEEAISNSPLIADFIEWSLGLKTHVFTPSLNGDLYYNESVERAPQITYIERKKSCVASLRQVLHSRNRDFIFGINWKGMSGLSEKEYASEIRKSSVFLNLSEAEGLPYSLLEAMKSGTLVAGFNSVGGQRELIGAGGSQNCILADNLDYVTLAQRMEPLLLDILQGDLSRWSTMQENGIRTAAAYSLEAERKSIVAMWKEILGI